MKERQKAMLKILLDNPSQFMSAQEIADRLSCSEKTVRNDSKWLDQWLSQHTQATLQRKPNAGFRLEVSESMRKVLLQSLYQVQPTDHPPDEKERVARILEILFIEGKKVTLQKLSELLFTPKTLIKKDLEKIERFIRKTNMQLNVKRNAGVEIIGNEWDWRLTLSALPSLLEIPSKDRVGFFSRFFTSHEINLVQTALDDFNQAQINPFTDETLSNLMIHILIAIKRIKQSHPIPFSSLELKNIKEKKEYRYASELIKPLERGFALRFPENETAFIAVHLMGGKVQKASPYPDDPELQRILLKLMEGISSQLGVDFTEDQALLQGLYVHLEATLNRIMHGLRITNPILSDIKRIYPLMFDSIMNELIKLKEAVGKEIPEDEAGYLTLHFQASLERIQKKGEKRKRAVIVCPMGIGASELLRSRLERKFHMLQITDTASLKNLPQYLSQKPDLIISTVPISDTTVPVVVVSPLLTTEEERKIQAAIDVHGTDSTAKQRIDSFPRLRSYLHENLMRLQLEADHRFEAIEHLATILFQEGYVDKAYIETAILRERHAPTTIGNGIAIPHGDPSHIRKPAIVVGTLKKPLLWGSEYVSLIFLLATKQSDYQQIRDLFRELSQLCDKPLLVSTLIKQKTPKEFIETLGDSHSVPFSS